jgi:hypothetical protein
MIQLIKKIINNYTDKLIGGKGKWLFPRSLFIVQHSRTLLDGNPKAEDITLCHKAINYIKT